MPPWITRTRKRRNQLRPPSHQLSRIIKIARKRQAVLQNQNSRPNQNYRKLRTQTKSQRHQRIRRRLSWTKMRKKKTRMSLSSMAVSNTPHTRCTRVVTTAARIPHTPTVHERARSKLVTRACPISVILEA